MRTITLDQQMGFTDALQLMLDGKCLGIRPVGNTGYVTLSKPHWMSTASPDSLLKWANSEMDTQIRSNQFMGLWCLVVVDHRCLMP